MARSRYRSVTYGLDASLALAEVVARAGGRTDVETLAAALSYSGVRNGAFLSRLANARLFGLVAGRSGEVVLTERGRRCLSADPAEQGSALAEACWAVPLFRRVLEDHAGRPLHDVDGLAETLESRFGENASKARTTARVLLESAGRAGLLSAGSVDLSLVTRSITNFTDSDSDPGRSFVPSVRWRRSPRLGRGGRQGRLLASTGGTTMDDGVSDRPAGHPSDDGGLWIDEGSGSARARANRRRIGVLVGIAACVALVGVPVGLLATSGPAPTSPSSAHHVSDGVARHSVLAALSATTDSGSFAFSYQLGETPPQVVHSTTVEGSGTINTNPTAMAASANLSSNGVTSLAVGVRVDSTRVWEVSNTDNGLTPAASDIGSGQLLSSFAGLVEGTLGQRVGAVAMMGMASPTGYLDLVEPAVSSTTEVGTSTVDGVAVTRYELTIDPSSLATAPGTSAEEQKTIDAALQVLTDQGYRAIHDVVSIDASGFIRESSSTVTFSDGGLVTLDAHFSNFGCAGTVLMPGQGGVSTPPAGCVSADTGTAPTSTTTSTTSTTSTSQSVPTTVPTATPGPASTTSTSASTTTTTAPATSTTIRSSTTSTSPG